MKISESQNTNLTEMRWTNDVKIMEYQIINIIWTNHNIRCKRCKKYKFVKNNIKEIDLRTVIQTQQTWDEHMAYDAKNINL